MQIFKVIMTTAEATFSYYVMAADMLEASTKVHRTDYISLDIQKG